MTARLTTLTVLALTAAGCNGSASLDLIPLNTRTLGPETTLSYTFELQECYWWIEDDGRVNLAMAFANLSPLGDLTRKTFDLSFVLEEPPASIGREYKAGRHTARGLWRDAILHLRLRSYRGILVLDRKPRERFVGQFRIYCSTKRFEVLTGWRRQSQVLVQGRFDAVHDAEAGRAIRDRTEEGQPRARAGAPPRPTAESGPDTAAD